MFKYVIALIAAPMIAQASFVVEADNSYRPDDFYTETINWCSNNNLMGSDSNGQAYEIANCGEQGLVCKTFKIYKMNKSIFTAACAAK